MWVLIMIATVLLGDTHNTVVEVQHGETVPPGCIDIQSMQNLFYRLALQLPLATSSTKADTPAPVNEKVPLRHSRFSGCEDSVF